MNEIFHDPGPQTAHKQLVRFTKPDRTGTIVVRVRSDKMAKFSPAHHEGAFLGFETESPVQRTGGDLAQGAHRNETGQNIGIG